MKRLLLKLGFSIVALFALTNCAKELESSEQYPAQEGSYFEIATEVDTKTINDGMNTKWDSADQLAVFYSPQNSGNYSDARQFSMIENNIFKGTIDQNATPLGSYNDWYAIYPHNSAYISPDGKTEVTIACPAGGSQKHDENTPMAHLAGEYFPLWGKDINRKSNERPVLSMHQVATLIKVNVKSSVQPALFCNIALQVPGKALVGAFNLDMLGSELTVTPVEAKTDEQALLTFSTVELAQNQTHSFYLAVAPFEVSQGDELILKVGNYGKVTSDTRQFKSGKINEINFNLNREPSVVTIPWKESFNLQFTSTYYNYSIGVKLYETGTAYAGGTLPELGIPKKAKDYNNKFVFKADLSGFNGKQLNLSYKSNHPDYLTVTTDNSNIILEETPKGSGFWDISVNGECPDPVTFNIENTTGSNVRIDDVQLTKLLKKQTLSFPQPILKVRGTFSSNGQQVCGNMTPVTYLSTNQAVAKIDARSGALTLEQLGKSTIKAVADGTTEYAPGQAEYDLIHLPEPSNIDKRDYLVVFKDAQTNKQYALSQIPNADNKHLEAVELTDLDAKMSNGEYVAENLDILWKATAVGNDNFNLKCGLNYLSSDNGSITVNTLLGSAAALTAVKVPSYINMYKLCMETETDLSFVKYDGSQGFRFSYGDHGDHILELIPARADTRPRLEAPNITVTSYPSSKYVRLMWAYVPNAEEYVVECDGQLYNTVTNNKYEIHNLEFGMHEFKVTARANGFINGVGVKQYEFVDPYNTQTILTLDFSTNIFELLTTNPSTHEVLEKTFEGYRYKLYGPGSCYYYGNKALFLGKAGAYIEFPALSSKRLISVSAINAQGASSSVELAVETSDSKAVSGGDNIVMTPEVEKTWNLSGTATGTSYRLVVKNKKNVQLTKIVLKYE